MHLLFIDFNQTLGRIDKKTMPRAFSKLGIPPKLTREINTKAKGVIAQKETNTFHIKSGEKQGDSLSTVIFNLVLHYAVKDHVKNW